MPVVIFLVAAVILGGIVVVAMGRGGELARDKADMPAAMDLRTWSDVARYRPPPALLGYHAGSTDQALMIIARAIAERDAEITWLRGRLAELQPESAGRGADTIGGPEAEPQVGAGDSARGADNSLRGADDSLRGVGDSARWKESARWTDDSARCTDEPVGRDGGSGAEGAEGASGAEGSHGPGTAEAPVEVGYWPRLGSSGRATND